MTVSRLDQLDYYTLLGVARDASDRDIKRAFRQFARKYHPDRFAGQPPQKVDRANQIYRRGSEGYQVLLDPVARRAYDANLARGRLRLSAEDRDRAQAAQRQAAQRKPRRPEDLVRSPQALAFYRKATEASRVGDWRGAWQALRKALEHEPNNQPLRRSLRKVEARIRAMG